MSADLTIRRERPDQPEVVKLYERCGHARCAPVGGYPDNGPSLFMAKRL